MSDGYVEQKYAIENRRERQRAARKERGEFWVTTKKGQVYVHFPGGSEPVGWWTVETILENIVNDPAWNREGQDEPA